MVARTSTTTEKQLAGYKPHARSKATNKRLAGRITAAALFVGKEVDGRSLWGRRYRDLVAGYVDDAGGLNQLSELRLGLIRRVAALTIEAEKMEIELAQGHAVDVDLLARLSSHIRRIAETIGLDRKVKDITPDLSEIIARYSEPQKPAGARKSGDAIVPAEPPTFPSDPHSPSGKGR